jgi:hypothetical protein
VNNSNNAGAHFATLRRGRMCIFPFFPSAFLMRERKVAYYFFGGRFSVREVNAALSHTNTKQTDLPVRDFILLCCEYSPLRGKYGNRVVDAVRAGGIGTVGAPGVYFNRPDRPKIG